jgi:hypothetical protein
MIYSGPFSGRPALEIESKEYPELTEQEAKFPRIQKSHST